MGGYGHSWPRHWVPTSVFHLLAIVLVLVPGFCAAEDLSTTDFGVPIWGPYRPSLYFGIRPRIQRSLLMGLMWADAENDAELQANLRHTCEHEEGMASFGWTSYDPRIGGRQVFNDAANRINLTADFIRDSGNGTGDRWGLRLNGVLRGNAKNPQRTTLIFYIGSEGKNSGLKCAPSPKNPKLYAMHTLCTGETPSLLDSSNWQIEMLANERQPNGKDMAVAAISTFNIPGENIWPVKSIYLGQLLRSDPSTVAVKASSGKGNLHIIAMTFTGQFDMDILFSSGDAVTSEPWSSFEGQISEAKSSFDDRFDKVYKPQSPFDGPEYLEFAKSVFADLMGSIGFYHGKSQVDVDPFAEGPGVDKQGSVTEERGPSELLTAVPSRARYPRGFLWDDGFHLQVIADWDMDLTLHILTSWLNLTDQNGWVAREQILGPEARRKVPHEFHTQFQTHANPTTLFLALDMFIDRYNKEAKYEGAPSVFLEDRKAGEAWLKSVYPQLQAYYDGWRHSQSGELDDYQYLVPQLKENFSEGYRWRGRSALGIIPSGFDDYPRATTPSETELHVDALAWVSLMGDVMRKAAIILGYRYDPAGDAFTYDTHYLKTSDTARAIHWSDADGAYCDVKLSSTGKLEHICHKGYVSLLPWIANTLFPLDQQHGHIGEVLDLITDPNHLWTSYGLRSLSKRDKYYSRSDEGWRSPIWVNMNYLVLVRLLNMAQKDGPYSRRAARIYVELRKNIVQTVFNSWKETGALWENYNQGNGRGQRTKHFTGWNSLVVRIMAMPSLEEKMSQPGMENEQLLTHSFSNPLDLSSNTLGIAAIVLFAVAVVFRRGLLAIWRNIGERFRR